MVTPRIGCEDWDCLGGLAAETKLGPVKGTSGELFYSPGTPKWMVYNGKSEKTNDDFMGYIPILETTILCLGIEKTKTAKVSSGNLT